MQASRTIDDRATLTKIYQQQAQILEALRSLQSAIAPQKSDDYWVLGFKELNEALKKEGCEVSFSRLQDLKYSNVLRSNDEDGECRNVGTPQVPRWRFHVGRCKEAIAQFELLPVSEQRRILGQ